MAERKVKRKKDKPERMKDDGGVKSDGGNVEKASRFFPFFRLRRQDGRRVWMQGVRGGVTWVVVWVEGVASRQPAWHSVPLGCIHLAQLAPLFSVIPLGTMHVTSQKLPDPQNVVESGFEPWNTWLQSSMLCLTSTFLNQRNTSSRQMRKKGRLNLRDIEFYPDSKEHSMVRGFISNAVSFLRTLHSEHTDIFTILAPRVYYSALLPQQWIWLHTYTPKLYADMQSISLKHTRLLLLHSVPKKRKTALTKNSSHVTYNQGWSLLVLSKKR